MTHQKIAKLAHVSVSTVSKALSGSREVSRELSEKIIKIAAEEGYFREKSKRRLDYLKKKTPIVAVICPEIKSIWYSEIITSLKKEIEARGGMAAVYISDFSTEKAAEIIETLVLKNSADGIVVFGKVKLKIKPNMPIVFFSDEYENEAFDTACPDMMSAITEAVGYLKNLGHEKIGFAGEALTMTKYMMFKEAMKNQGLFPDEKFVYITDKRFEEIGYGAVDEMLKRKELPTAVLAAYDEAALAIIHRLKEHKIRVPEDISVMGINDIPQSSYALVPLTTIKMFYAEECSNIAEIIYKKIYDESKTITHTTVKHKLIIRDSTAPVKKIRNF